MQVLECLDETDVCSKHVLNAIHFLNKAWRWITEKTVWNSFWLVGFAKCKYNSKRKEDEEDLPLLEWNCRFEDMVICLFATVDYDDLRSKLNMI